MKNYKLGDLYAPEFKEMQPEAIKEKLASDAYAEENEGYKHILTDEEISKKSDILVQSCIDIVRLEKKKKEINAEIKDKLAQPIALRNELVDIIRDRSEHVRTTVYLVDDQKLKKMYLFDPVGVCVGARDLLPNENQLKLTNNVKND